MSKTARRLGRGLDSLVSNLREDLKQQTVVETDRVADTGLGLLEGEHSAVRMGMIAVGRLRANPFQPRGNITDAGVLSLAESIDQRGMLQPIVVRVRSGGGYEIVAGERRWRAAKSLGLEQVPVIVREATDEEMLELALIENIQREDLNAIDRARAYQEFCRRFSARAEDLAKRLGEDRTTVLNYLRLLDLPDSIQELVAQRKLSMGHARCLLGVTSEKRRTELADAVVENELSVRALEEIVRREKTRESEKEPVQSAKDRGRSVYLYELQERFMEAIKTKVTIHEGKRKGSGRIVIEYYSLDDFDRIAACLDVKLE